LLYSELKRPAGRFKVSRPIDLTQMKEQHATMSEKAPLFIKINPSDNVAVATQNIAAGTRAADGIVAKTEIPMGHKIALVP
jgi:hypothetical protein